MAARINTKIDPATRTRIKTTQLVKRLQGFVLGARDAGGRPRKDGHPSKEPGPITLSPAQVTAGLGLLKKVLPDLAATEHSGAIDGTLTVVRRVRRDKAGSDG